MLYQLSYVRVGDILAAGLARLGAADAARKCRVSGPARVIY
jgi:hypothetical protein